MKKLLLAFLSFFALSAAYSDVKAQYCTPTYTLGTVDGDYISNVNFGSISNSTPASPAPFYTSYTSLSTTVSQGQSYQLTVTSGSYAGTNVFAVFIDFNQDFVFSTAEKIGEVQTNAAFATAILNVPIPLTALTGLTRMRVINSFNSGINLPCGTYTYGETEDYSVNITAGSGLYCTPSFLNGTLTGYYIDGFEFESIFNPGTGSPGGSSYTNYSPLSATVAAGGSYTAFITTGIGTSSNCAIFADLNADNDFVDAGELLVQQILPASFTAYSLPVNIPASAIPSNTRLRVVCTNQSQLSPALVACGSYNAGEAEDYDLTITPGGSTAYCTPVHSVACGTTFINGVSINATTLNNQNTGCTGTSGAAYTQYGLATNTTATLNIGSTYTINTILSGDVSVSVWIDYNQNNVFDASEWIQVATTTVTGTTYSAAFTVPTSAISGTTRMRIRCRATSFANGSVDACTSFGSGETEDYSITLNGAAPPCVPIHTTSCSSLFISNVTILSSTLNNSSGCLSNNGQAYTIYSPVGNQTGSVSMGVPFTLNVTTSAASDISVWFDLNQNGTFEATEWIQVALATTSGSVLTLLPLGPQSGPIGMRIRARVPGVGNGAGDACTSFGSGESEDYTINLINAGTQPPIADFFGQLSGTGNGIDFIDQSFNNPSSWNWIFEGAVPSTSNQQFPTNIQYPNPGCFDVTLIVSNSAGIDTLILPCYVSLQDPTTCQSLFISEMVESTGNNKSIEIYNPSSTSVSLSAYSVAVYANGSIVPTSIVPLSGTLAANDVFVVSNNLSTLGGITSVTDQFSAGINFTGNDAVALIRNGIKVDLIGTIGQDSLWIVNGLSLQDNTISRSSLVDRPDAFWPDARLTYTNLGAGNLTGLGAHTSNCLVVPNTCSTVSTFCSPANITLVGNGTQSNTNTSYPAIYGNYYKAGKTQMLYTAAELQAVGIIPGRISAISTTISTLNGGTNLYRGFTIRMGCTNQTTLGGAYLTGLSQVFDPKNVTILVGTNTHNFDRSFVWDGSSNIVVEFCFNNLIDPNFTSNASTTFTVTPNASVQYSVDDVTDPCPATTTLEVSNQRPNIRFHYCANAGNPPVANFQANQTQICAGSSACVNFTDLSSNNPTSWQWTFPGSTVGSSTQQNPGNVCYTSPGTYSVTLVASNANGSNSLTLQQYITVTQPPVVNASAANTSICAGNSVQLTASGATTYQWTPTTGLSNPSVSNPLASPSTTTTYQVIGTTNNCSATSNSITITVVQNNLNAGNDVSICPGSSTQLSASGATSYQWFPTTGLSNAGIPNPVANPSTTTTYTVTGLINGCTFTDQVTVTVSALTANAGTDQTICAGSSASLQGQGNGTASWSPTTGLSAPNQLFTLANPSVTTTYTLTISNNGCTATDQVTVFVNSVNANAGQDLTICPGATAQLSASGGGTYQWSPSGTLSNPSISNPLAAPSATTTYTVLVTNNGCTASDQVVVNVHVSSGTGGPDQTVCNGSSVTLNASGGTSYTWTPSTGLSNPTIANPVASPNSTTTYTVQINDGICTITDQVLVTVNTVQASASAQPSSICNGSSTILTATGGTQYSWSPTTGLSNPFSASTSASPAQTTLYTVTATSNGCTATAQVLVTVNNVVANAGQDQGICVGGSIQLQGSGGVSYQWSPSAGLNNPNIPNPIASPQTTTTYTLTVSAGGCSSTDQVTVQVLQVSANAGSDQNTCFGSSVNLSATGGVTYSWFPATGLSNPTIANPVANPAQTTTYVLTAFNGQCSATDTVTVNVIQVTANAGQDQTVCAGSSIQLNATGGTSYAWTPALALSNPAIENPIANPTSTTTYTVVVSTGTCSASDQVVVTVVPGVLNLSASNDTTVCAGSAVPLNASGGNAYSWSPSTGLSNPAISNPVATPAQTTTYTVTVSNGVCSASEPVLVTVNQVVLSTSPDQILCAGSVVTLSASGASSYQWSPSAGLSNPSVPNPVANPSVSTMYVVTGTANGCTGVDSVFVEVSTLSANAGADVSVCAGSSIQLNATGGTTYQWTPAAGLNNSSIATPLATPTATTTYTILVSDGICSASDQITVTVVPGASGFFAQGDTSICAGGTATLVSGGVSSYTWFPASGLSNPTGATTQANPSQTTTYTVTGSNGTCTASLPVTVTVNNPVVSSIADQTICSGDTVLLTANGATTYNWAPTTGLQTPNQSGTNAFPSTTTTYVVTGTISGCSASDTVTVVVNTVNLTASADQTICAGETVTLSASGAAGYIWFPSSGLANPFSPQTPASPLVTTTYFVTGTIGSCSDVDTILVSVNPAPATPVITLSGTDLTTGVYDNYQWFFNGAPIAGETNQGIFPAQVGDYTVVVTNAAGCSASSAPFTVLTVSLAENSMFSQVMVYPNPFTGQVTLSFVMDKSQQSRLVLRDASGRLVEYREINLPAGAGTMEFNWDTLADGMYFLELSGLNSMKNFRIIKE